MYEILKKAPEFNNTLYIFVNDIGVGLNVTGNQWYMIDKWTTFQNMAHAWL